MVRAGPDVQLVRLVVYLVEHILGHPGPDDDVDGRLSVRVLHHGAEIVSNISQFPFIFILFLYFNNLSRLFNLPFLAHLFPRLSLYFIYLYFLFILFFILT